MPLRGSAFVIMWHDIASESDAAYNLWHTREHMPERIALPGFLRARRGLNRGLDRQIYFTLYELAGPESFLSPEYLRSLNYPTEWTQSVAPQFRNFLRMPCAVRASMGEGVGGAIATFRLTLDGRPEDEVVAALEPALDALMSLPSVSAAHIGAARSNYSGGNTRETEIRPQMAEPPFDVIVIVEGIGLAEVIADQPAMERALAEAGAGPLIGQCYDMAYLLTPAAA